MTFQQAVRTVLNKYATFSGRAGKPEYWWWVLFMVIVNIVTGSIDQVYLVPRLGLEPIGDTQTLLSPLSMLVGLLVFLPSLAVNVRRLHDTGKSGLWIVINFVPLIGWVVYIFWMVQRGNEGENRFGPPPQRDAELVM